MGRLLSQHSSEGEQGQPFEHDGVRYGPEGLESRHWSVDRRGLRHLAQAGRLWSNVPEGRTEAGANQLHLKVYRSEMPGRRITNVWTQTIAASDKRYPVQTGELAIQRCMLMTTRPGDLVLDPTNGGGTTAVVAETWGRRWIAIDSSRESLAVTRERVLMRNYPAHELVGSPKGFEREQQLRAEVGEPLLTERPEGGCNDPATGIVVERMKYVSAATLAYAERPDKRPKREWIRFVDRPIGRKDGRVCSQFTVETEHVADMLSPDELRRPMQLRRDADWEDRVKSALLAGGFGAESGSRFQVDELSSVAEDAEGGQDAGGHQAGLRWNARVSDMQSGRAMDVAIAVHPHDSKVDHIVTHRMVTAAMKRGRKALVVVGVEFGEGTERREWAMPVIRVRASVDLHLSGVRSKGRGEADSPRLFVVAELAVAVEDVGGGMRRVELHGLNEYNPVDQEVSFRPAKDVRLWMLDTDYDDLQFHACRIHLPGKARKARNRKLLAQILGKGADPDAMNVTFGYRSHPFSAPTTGKVAVRAVLKGGGLATTAVPVA